MILVNNELTDSGLFVFRKMRDLQYLDLQHQGASSAGITDAGLRHLADLAALKELMFFSTDISDEGLAKLTKTEDLKLLMVGRSHITPEGVAELQKQPPNCKILN